MTYSGVSSNPAPVTAAAYSTSKYEIDSNADGSNGIITIIATFEHINLSVVTNLIIDGLAPTGGGTPKTSITGGTQYTGMVVWDPVVSTEFAFSTTYTATITITPGTGFGLPDASTVFDVKGADPGNVNYFPDLVNGVGVITVIFPATGAKPPTFTFDSKYNIPASEVGVPINPIDFSGGVSGGSGNYAFSASGLPAGLFISAAGILSGTPLIPGPAGTATITVTDIIDVTSASISIEYGAIAASTAKVVYVESQTDALVEGKPGVTKFNIVTANIPDNAICFLSWYTGADTTTTTTQPVGFSVGLSKTSFSSAVMTINADPMIEAGTYYFTITIDGIISNVASVVVSSASSTTRFAITIAPSAGGTVSSNLLSATVGTNITLTILPDGDSELSAINVYRTGSGGSVAVVLKGDYDDIRTFVMPAYDVTVVATFKIDTRDGTDIETVTQAADLKAYGQNGRLYVSGLTAGSPWYVFNINGTLVYNSIADSDKAVIDLPVRGIYIIRSGDKAIKAYN